MLTLVAESGADASTVGRIAGPSSVVISRRYMQRWPETPGRAFERSETNTGGRKFVRRPENAAARYSFRYSLMAAVRNS